MISNTIDLNCSEYNKYLNCSEELINELLEQNKNQIMKKVVIIDDNQFVFVFNKKNYDYDNQDLISMFRSVLYVIEDNKYKILNYTYNNVVYNTNVIYNQDIYESYEGSNITFFNYKNIWYYTTSKNITKVECLDNSVYGKMILETFNNKMEDVIKLQDIMNIKYNYNFILVNYNNRYIHDYTNIFGLNYTKLIFTDSKYQESQIPLEDENFNNLIKDNVIFKNIIKPNKIDIKKVNLEYNEYIIKKYDGFLLKIIKLVSSDYLYKKDLKGNTTNKLEVYINNYKKNKIDELLKHFKSYNIYIQGMNMKQVMCLLFSSLSELLYIFYKYKYEDIKYNEDMISKYTFTINFIDNVKKISLQNNKNSTSYKFIYNHLKNYTYSNLIYNILNELFKDINNIKKINNEICNFVCDKYIVINCVNNLL